MSSANEAQPSPAARPSTQAADPPPAIFAPIPVTALTDRFTPTMKRSKVAALRTRPESVLADIARLCDLAELPARSELTLVCDTSRRAPPSGGRTPPWLLEGALIALHRKGFDSVDAIAHPACHESPELDSVLRAHALSAIQRREATVEHKPRARMHALPKAFPEGILVSSHLVDRGVVALASASPSARGGAMELSLSLLGARAHRVRPWRERALVDLLAIQREVHPARFYIADATATHGDVILASRDPVALDAALTVWAGGDPWRVERLCVAHDDRLGVCDPREIELVGDASPDDRWNTYDRPPRPPPLRARPLSALRRALALAPLTRLREALDELHTDRIAWPLRERDAYARWRESNPWGRLDARYAREGALSPTV